MSKYRNILADDATLTPHKFSFIAAEDEGFNGPPLHIDFEVEPNSHPRPSSGTRLAVSVNGLKHSGHQVSLSLTEVSAPSFEKQYNSPLVAIDPCFVLNRIV